MFDDAEVQRWRIMEQNGVLLLLLLLLRAVLGVVVTLSGACGALLGSKGSEAPSLNAQLCADIYRPVTAEQGHY